MHTIRLLGAAALVLAASAASAQSMKPGLWEVTTKMKSSNGEMEKAMAEAQKQMAAMPPEQRKMMQEMMAKNGMSMGTGSPGGGISMKVCMTKEMVERSEVPPPQGDCKTTTSARSGNTTEMSYTCTNPPSSGKGKFTFISNEAYTSQMTATSTGRGKPEQMDIDSAGKWLAADCGTIKPIAPPVAKK
jgi:hypothetical protein